MVSSQHCWHNNLPYIHFQTYVLRRVTQHLTLRVLHPSHCGRGRSRTRSPDSAMPIIHGASPSLKVIDAFLDTSRAAPRNVSTWSDTRAVSGKFPKAATSESNDTVSRQVSCIIISSPLWGSCTYAILGAVDSTLALVPCSPFIINCGRCTMNTPPIYVIAVLLALAMTLTVCSLFHPTQCIVVYLCPKKMYYNTRSIQSGNCSGQLHPIRNK